MHEYRHTFVICNNYCLPTATVVMRTRLNVTLYVQYLYIACLVCSYIPNVVILVQLVVGAALICGILY